MPIFEIETPDGVFEVDAPDERSALAATQKPAAPAQPSQSGGGSLAGAGTTWLEHAISDIPLVGPLMQKGSDFLGTEVIGRLSGQDPGQMRADLQARRDQRTQDYPMSATSGALAGNLAAFGGAGATASGARALGITGETLGGRVLNSAISSGGISAADTMARGGDIFDAGTQGAVGAGIGAGIPVIGSLIRAGIGAVGDKVAPTINALRDAPKEATRRLGLAVERDRVANPQALVNSTDEAVARENSIPLLNVDRGGETTRALARSVANQSPEARATIEKVADDRFAGQSQRASEFIRRMTGGAVDDIGYQNAIRDTARYVNKPAYDRAFSEPAAQEMWDRGFQQLMQAPAMQKAVRGAVGRGANRAAVEGFQAVKNPFVEHNGQFMIRVNEDGSIARPTLQFWDQVKRNLDSEIGKAGRAGDNTFQADLLAIKKQLVDMMDSAVPSYQKARQGAASFFGADDAIEAGKKFATTPRLVPEARAAYEKFAPAEKAGFATGYASELIDRIKASGDRTNVINQVFKSQSARESMELVFGPQKMKEVEAYVRVEDLVDRLRGAMGNSTTARQLVELGIGAGSGFAVTGGDWKGALGGAALAKGGRMLGQRVDDKVMQQIAQMLTSNNPQTIQSAVKLAAQGPAYMKGLEDFGRLLAAPARGTALAVQ